MIKLSLFFIYLIVLKSSVLPFLCPVTLINDNLNCTILSGSYIPLNNIKANPNIFNNELKIANFNIDRNGGIDSMQSRFLEILENLSINDLIISADVLIITELARDCRIYAEYVDGPTMLAEKLSLSFAYAVEYVENYKPGDEHQCTIGNAIFSKYPLKNIEEIRFISQCCKYDIRWGGRVTIVADIEVNDRIMSFYSTHLESGQNSLISVIHGFIIRWLQMNELIKHANDNKYFSDYVIIGGDLNAPLGLFDIVNLPLFIFDYKDSHFSFSFTERATCPLGELEKYGLFLFDYIWIKTQNEYEFKNAVICKDDPCKGLSDHYPMGVQINML